ncbi:hypothetical protein [Actinomycetospora sp. CA-053990]|uniref:hypothetical protein n=1 Tax=Actinomycetospora sp. CA-053990 TaxID=3239891 RepID=UPI003D8E9307
MKLLLVVVLALLAGCAVTPERAAPPVPELGQALRFAALAPLPAEATVLRLESQGGIDTLVTLTVRLPVAAVAPWLKASGVSALGAQQRVANPDGAVIYRTATAAGTDVTVRAFTT